MAMLALIGESDQECCSSAWDEEGVNRRRYSLMRVMSGNVDLRWQAQPRIDNNASGGKQKGKVHAVDTKAGSMTKGRSQSPIIAVLLLTLTDNDGLQFRLFFAK